MPYGFTPHLNKSGSSLLPPCIFPFFPPLPKLQHKEEISRQHGRAWVEGSNRVDPTSGPTANKELPSTFLLLEEMRRGGALGEKKDRALEQIDTVQGDNIIYPTTKNKQVILDSSLLRIQYGSGQTVTFR
jgi:hypothetical protein